MKASEMESAARFVVSAALGCRSGSCFHVIWNQERELAGLDQTMSVDTTAAVRVVVEALKLLIEEDRTCALGSDRRRSYAREFPVSCILRQRVIWQPYSLSSLSS